MIEIDPNSPALSLIAAWYDKSGGVMTDWLPAGGYAKSAFLRLAAEHERLVQERLAAVIAERDAAVEELAVWKSVFPDIAPDAVLPDRSALQKQLALVKTERDRLRDALETLFDVQGFATGWDNGVTDSTGTINEGAHWHNEAMDKARAVLSPEAKQ